MRHDEGFFSARDNSRLFWQAEIPDAPRAHVALVHGYADHCGRYRRVIDSLAKDGFAVHSFDYRGHGKADGKRGFVARWSDYLDDLGAFWQRVRKAAGPQKTFLMGHSHGGLMSTHFAAGKPEGISGLILSSPYLKLALTPPAMKVLGAKLVGTLVPWMPVKTEFTEQDLSRDVEWQKETAADPLYFHIVTPRFFTESNKAQVEALTLGPTLDLPVFMFVGEKDGIASPTATRAFFETVASSDKRFKEYPGMKHEVLCEIGKEEVWKDVSGWISSHL